MKPFKAEYDQNFLGPYTGLNSEHCAARGKGGRKGGKSEQKTGHEEKESRATRSRSMRWERVSTSAYRFDRLLLLFEQTFRTAVSSHPYNYTAVSFLLVRPFRLTSFSLLFFLRRILCPLTVMPVRSVIKYGLKRSSLSSPPSIIARLFLFLLLPRALNLSRVIPARSCEAENTASDIDSKLREMLSVAN